MIPITNDNNSHNIKKMQNNHNCNCITNSKTNAYINNNNYNYNKNENCIWLLIGALLEEDYFAVFHWCSVPWALARVDGRLCDCNESFSKTSGYSRNEILSFTIFNLIHPVDLQDTFR